MHGIYYMCLGVTEDFGSSSSQIEFSNESSGQHTACEGVSHARRATDLAKPAGAGRWA